MTPLIQEFVAMNPSGAVEYHWFDMTGAYRKEQPVISEILGRPLPYPKTALVCAYEDKKAFMFIYRTDDVTGVGAFQIENKKLREVTPFFFTVDDEGVKVRHKDGTPFDYRTSPATGVLAFIAAFMESLEVTPATGYQPIKRANWEKKVRQGKAPTYDWKTVVIEPTKPRSADQGGTHASPRWHERRGHWRNMKSGKKVWVKNCEVGNKALGAVFKDYKIKETA